MYGKFYQAKGTSSPPVPLEIIRIFSSIKEISSSTNSNLCGNFVFFFPHPKTMLGDRVYERASELASAVTTPLSFWIERSEMFTPLIWEFFTNSTPSDIAAIGLQCLKASLIK